MTKMKPLFLIGIIVLIFGLTSCESAPEADQVNTVRKNIEKTLVKKLHKPKSYEFGELRLTDSTLYKDNVQYHRNFYSMSLKADQDNLEKQLKFKAEGSSEYREKKANYLVEHIEKNQKILNEIDRLAAELGDKTNDVAAYTYTYNFKSKNTAGVMSEYTYIVQTKPAPGYQIIELVENEAQAILHPNDFPGYNEMIENFH